MVDWRNYAISALITIIVGLLLYLVAFNIDDSRLADLDSRIENITENSQQNRVMLFYSQIFSKNNQEFCSVLTESNNKQLNTGYELLRVMQKFEEANLLADYNLARRQYILNNIELWLNTSYINQTCNTDTENLLFFYKAKEICLECIAQGEVLDQIRTDCSNAKIYAIASDVELEIVTMLKEKFNIKQNPSIVINSSKTITGLTSKQDVLKEISCT